MPKDPDLSRWLSDDFDPAEMTRQMEAQTAKLEAMQERLAETALTVRSPDRLVSVTVAGSGAVTGLDIHPSAFTDLEHDRIAPLLLRTIQEAAHQAGDQIREGLTDVLGDSELVDQSMRGWTGLVRPVEDDAAVEDQETRRLLGQLSPPG
ncbi:MAG: YbaB/EbfC family nucleoid-associated protein [Dermatophilaceae bacterium]